ncbi:LysR family transcriptional regulator ArgP [Parasulfitobacter algicola]|uniref:LysR family transcriptional regulator ArgP n=1 Tax=Parasulfitobacter algicola TaxID=2614809 RepID=A0ABX2J146_9RHOB|nr:LysR family transcriptional regulator ArgP [Sulfitobacter algicola]NSX56543.1 LysR family transcriptional regulator ArgP [Sulfitobacter algicola]
MLDYSFLFTLSAVVTSGSFDQAATQLGLTPSAVSQRIKALEDRVGTVLIIRGQPCTATKAGDRLIRHVQDVQALEHTLGQDIGTLALASPTSVRIAVNADSLATWFMPALARTNDLLFDLEIDDQDHSDDWLRHGKVLAAITSRKTPVQGCNSYNLGKLRYLATASPDFMAQYFPDGITQQTLKQAPALTFNRKDSLQRDWISTVLGKPVTVPSHMMASSQGFVDAACLGLGWGMNPLDLVKDHIAAGRLVTLLGTPLDIPLYWQVSRVAKGALQQLTRNIQRAARLHLIQ